MNEEERLKYTSSATHQEIAAGIMRYSGAQNHAFCFSINIADLADMAAGDARSVNACGLIDRYIDCNSDGSWDRDAYLQLSELKNNLKERLGSNFVEFAARFENVRLSAGHIGSLPENILQKEKDGLFDGDLSTLCGAAWTLLSSAIRSELELMRQQDKLLDEINSHVQFGAEQSAIFVGRSGLRRVVNSYINSCRTGPGKGYLNRLKAKLFNPAPKSTGIRDFDARHPLVVVGETGMGKTALLARVAADLQGCRDINLVQRYIGITGATDPGLFLRDLCSEIKLIYGITDLNLKSAGKDIGKLARQLFKLLHHAGTIKPLVVIIDGLDSFFTAGSGMRKDWIPGTPPGSGRLFSR